MLSNFSGGINLINDCKLRVTVKHEKLFESNLSKKGWVQAGTGLFTKTFGSDTQAEIHRKILPFTGQTYFSVYITDPETLTKKILYEICDELEDIETKLG
jgi:hypothetical protein